MAISATILMNAKTEYSRCVLPGISPAPTNEEKKEDDRIKELIRVLKLRKEAAEKQTGSLEAQAQGYLMFTQEGMAPLLLLVMPSNFMGPRGLAMVLRLVVLVMMMMMTNL